MIIRKRGVGLKVMMEIKDLRSVERDQARGAYRVLKSILISYVPRKEGGGHTVEEDLEGGGVLSVVGDNDT